MKQEVVGNLDKVLWILMGGIGLVLLIACANVANLLLVRAEGASRSLASALLWGQPAAVSLRDYSLRA